MNYSRYLLWILAFSLLTLASCSRSENPLEPTLNQTSSSQDSPATTKLPTETATPNSDELYSGTDGNPWWNDAVFYEVFVRSFQDSDGDGIGDINGLIERLDYLNDGDPNTTDDLGVTGIWLMPITESPSYHGYDVTDYFAVDEEYGTEDDFCRLIEEAHARGIRVVIDLVINHTSSLHPWFEASLDPGSDQRDWYVWSDDNPGFRGPSGQQVWHRSGDDYYYALFWDQMPDLNFENPEVTEAVYEAADFWLSDMGVDGFRLDAIKHLVENGQLQENTKGTHQWLEDFYTFYKEVDPKAFTVGEAWTSTQQVLEYTGDEVDIAFQFDLAEDILNTSEVGLGNLFIQELTPIVDTFPKNQFATFITNHDQNRVMSQLDGDTNAAKVAASLLLTGPGVPFIYYGEEIGMQGTKPDEDIRRPMQWAGDNIGVGFTDGLPWRAPFEDYQERNVEQQDADPDSLLNHYRELIQLRNKSEALRIGDLLSVNSTPNKIVAFLRHSEDETLLVIINPSRDTLADYVLNLDSGPLENQAVAELILGEGSAVGPTVNEAGGFSEYRPLESLPPQSTFIIDLSTG